MQTIQPQVESRINRTFLACQHSVADDQPMVYSQDDDSLKTFASRLDFALRARGRSQTWLAERLGVSDQAVSKWKLAGKISRENLFKVCQELLLDPLWLIMGEGDRPAPGAEQGISGYTARPRLPVVGTAQLGDDGYWAELDYPPGHGDGYLLVASRDPNAYAVGCRGESMKPRIKSGEFVVVEPNRVLQPGDEVLVKDIQGRVMVKEWLFTRDGIVHLLSANEAHGKITLPTTEVDVMHFVAAIVKPSLWRDE